MGSRSANSQATPDYAWGSFTKIWKDTMNLLVKGTGRTQMKVIGKTTIKTSATCDIGRLTKTNMLMGGH